MQKAIIPGVTQENDNLGIKLLGKLRILLIKMDLLEYQAKKLFHQIGIPVLPSEIIVEPRALKQLQIPYPVVLKSQVRVGGRGKAGGIKFVGNTIDAIAAARNIFNLSILGEYPKVILAEARYDCQQELFLSVALDYELQCPIIFGSSCGGIDTDLLKENLKQEVVTGEFSPYIARSLAVKMGLRGELMLRVSEIISKMYRLFESRNLELIEINPLAVDGAKRLMALDGKIKLNDRTISRYPDIELLVIAENSYHQASVSKINIEAHKDHDESIRWLNWQNNRNKGKIAIIGSEENSALVCWDIIKQEKGKPSLGLVLEPTIWNTVVGNQTTLLAQKLREVLASLQERKIEIVLFNLWVEEINITRLGQFLYDWCQITPQIPTLGLVNSDKAIPFNVFPPPIKFVLRVSSNEIAEYREKFAHAQIFWTNDLTEAINLTISLSNTK